MPGRHWVWNSFSNKIHKISALMILSSHVISYEDLKLRKSNKCLLLNRDCFKCYKNLYHDNDIDGNYIVYDKNRQVYIRSGMVAAGLLRRWKEHVSASMLYTHVHRSSKLYTAYPNSMCDESILRNVDGIKGNFQQLEPLSGMGFNRAKKDEINALFHWSKSEELELEILSGSGKHQPRGQTYRHLCYIFETAYGLALDPRRNISSNPGCEWQLRFYGE